MTDETNRTTELDALLNALRQAEGTGVPTGSWRRTMKLAGTMAGAGFSMLSGRLRGRGEAGLGRAHVKTIEGMVRSFGELKGLAMKAGQILSYIDDTMPSELQELLSLLQTQSQPADPEAIRATIRQDLGERGEQLLAGLEPKPVSVASIGQVHRAGLPDGTPVAVKVLHPGVREGLEADFKTAKLGPVFARITIPGGGAESMKGFIREMHDRMIEECDYALEAERQRRFGSLFADHSTILVPRVLDDWCGPRVLVTAWEPGDSLEQFLVDDPSQELRDRVGEALFDVYFGTLYRHGLFHADPHPGNYSFRSDGRVVLYDFGCAREFDRETVIHLSRLAHATATDNEAEIRQAFSGMGGLIPESEKAYDHVRRLLRSFFQPLLTPGRRRVEAGGIASFGEVVRDKRMLMRLRLPPRLMFLFRIRYGLYAVLARIGSRCDWAGLERRLYEEVLLPKTPESL